MVRLTKLISFIKILGVISLAFCGAMIYHQQTSRALLFHVYSDSSINLYPKENNIENNGTWHQQQVLLLSYMRCGTSFTGEILQAIDENFYFFEPLFVLEEKQPIKRLFANLRYDLTFLKEAVQDTKKLLSCDFPSLNNFLRLGVSKLKSSRTAKDLVTCFTRHKTQNVETECLASMQEQCQKYDFVSAKILRLPFRVLEPLMREMPHLKIIHLVRDPRPTLISHVNIGFKSSIKQIDDTYSQTFCNEVLEDHSVGLMLKSLFPGRLLTLRYETLASDPIPTSQLVYDFLGVPMTSQMKDRIQHLTQSNKKGVRKGLYSVYQSDSRSHLNKWREKASLDFVKTVDESCASMYRVFGYRPLSESVDMIRNLTNTFYTPHMKGMI